MVTNCLGYAKKAKKEGKPIVGIFCEYTPRELIIAAGAVPVCMCGGSSETIPAAEEELPSNLCPLIKSSYGFAKLKWNPFLEMADLLIAETTCDGKKKMYELLSRKKEMYVLEMTQKPDDRESFKHWKEEIVKMKKFLEKKFKVSITDKKLRQAINTMNRERKLRKELAELAAGQPPLISGFNVLLAKSLISGIPKDFKMYESLIGAVKKQAKRSGEKYAGLTRVLLTGVPMPHEAEKVMNIIEESGGTVVAQETCTGLKPLDELVCEKKSPVDAIAEKYFHLPCSCMTPNKRRFDLLDSLVEKYAPQAVVELIWQACHTYNIEAFMVQGHIEKKHKLPYLKLETDYSPSDSARLKVRIQALLEIAKNKPDKSDFDRITGLTGTINTVDNKELIKEIYNANITN
jgi:benzoyl-CoA reductase/2-hydroxyglutaryl-CoA dehydratase subunit BcrC/BadD/HgdB